MFSNLGHVLERLPDHKGLPWKNTNNPDKKASPGGFVDPKS
jgi:hypothetical protein